LGRVAKRKGRGGGGGMLSPELPAVESSSGMKRKGWRVFDHLVSTPGLVKGMVGGGPG